MFIAFLWGCSRIVRIMKINKQQKIPLMNFGTSYISI